MIIAHVKKISYSYRPSGNTPLDEMIDNAIDSAQAAGFNCVGIERIWGDKLQSEWLLLFEEQKKAPGWVPR